MLILLVVVGLQIIYFVLKGSNARVKPSTLSNRKNTRG
jgi:hypothetical protein